MTTFLSPIARIGTFSSFTTSTFSQVSFKVPCPITGSSMASVSVFQVPMSFQSPENRMTWMSGSCSATA